MCRENVILSGAVLFTMVELAPPSYLALEGRTATPVDG